MDTLYASFPAYLYLNVTWARYLLTPLLEFQDSSLYSNISAMDGLGESLDYFIKNNSIKLTGIRPFVPKCNNSQHSFTIYNRKYVYSIEFEGNEELITIVQVPLPR